VVAAVLAVAAVALAAYWLGSRSGDDTVASGPDTSATTATAPPPASDPTIAPTTAPTSAPTSTPTTSGPAWGIGVEWTAYDLPAPDLELVAGSLVTDMPYTVDLLSTPTGYQLWLSEQLGYDGDVLRLRLTDVVELDDIYATDSQVLGGTPCTVAGLPTPGVVAIFTAEDVDPLTDPRLAWVVEPTVGAFVPPDGPVACTNEFLGI
jgi:hypothetical protein